MGGGVEADIIRSSQEIDGVEYVFLGGKDEGAGGEGAGGMCRCRRGFKSRLVVREGEESDLVKLG
jgi:hypothetical protein